MVVNPIESINEKIIRLVAKYEALRSENAELTSRIASMKRDIETKCLTIKELEERIDKLQLTSAFENSAKDKSQAKRKISQLMREIENCIELLED